MLPVINLSATNMATLYSLLYLVVEQSKTTELPIPPIKFDQPLFVKAGEVVMSNNMKIFVCLDDFHHLISFLGSTGASM